MKIREKMINIELNVIFQNAIYAMQKEETNNSNSKENQKSICVCQRKALRKFIFLPSFHYQHS